MTYFEGIYFESFDYCIGKISQSISLQVNGVEVMRVIRRGATAVHFLPQAIPEGTEVELVVDWPRRFDHMQQHSGKKTKSLF